MDVKNWIKQIQQKPYETKVKILWITTLVIGVLLLIVWIASLKSTVANLNDNSEENPQTPESSVRYVKIERVELEENSTKIFFAVKNDTDDILNFSTTEDIALDIDSSGLKANRVLDRQNRNFVNKILSHTEQFGILVFNKNLEGLGELTFNQLFFEKQPSIVFKETVEVDFDKLTKKQELRD